MAAELGYVVIESTKCPHCQHTALYAHLFNERLTCQKCKGQYPSAVPRPPQEGEVLAEHYDAALNSLHRHCDKEIASLGQITDEELETYPEFVRTAMKRFALREAKKVLETAKKVAMQYAEL